MRTITLGTKGWILLGVAVALFAGGVWAWQAGYLPEIGRFFAAEPGAPVPVTIKSLDPNAGPVGTHVSITGDNLPGVPDRSVKVHFGGGVIEGVNNGSYVEFVVPSEMPVYCPPGAYCILAMLPVQPGSYPVALERGTACPTATPTPIYGPDDLPAREAPGEASLECGVVRSNTLAFTVTNGPVASCVPLPRCVYEGNPRCAVDPAPGTVYCPAPSPTPSCMPRPACLDARPSCDIAEPADGWCPPGPGDITVNRPPAGGTVVLGDTSYSITWNTRPYLLPSGPMDIMLRRSDTEPRTYIARGVPNQGWYNWDTTKPGRLEDGTPVDFLNITTGPDFIVRVSIPGTNISGESGVFSIVRGTVTPTPPLPGNRSAELVPGFQMCNSLGCMLAVEVRPNGNAVTAVTAHLRVQGGTFNDNFQPGSFPQFLENGFTTPDRTGAFFSFGISAGSAGVTRPAGTGSVGVTFNRTTMRPGDPICVSMDLVNSRVAATGSTGNVLSQNYPGSQVCMPIPPYVTPTSALPGDVDRDGDVDIFDYNIVVTNFGANGARQGDADGDGDVDIFDYNIVVTNFGRS